MAVMKNTMGRQVRGQWRERMAGVNGAGWAYLREFGGAIILYTIVLPISIVLVEGHSHAWWRVPVALAPVVPASLAVWAFVRSVRRMDELQRQIQFEALVVSFGATALLTFSYGFLENVGFPHLSWILILPLMVGLWGLALAVTSARYR